MGRKKLPRMNSERLFGLEVDPNECSPYGDTNNSSLRSERNTRPAGDVRSAPPVTLPGVGYATAAPPFVDEAESPLRFTPSRGSGLVSELFIRHCHTPRGHLSSWLPYLSQSIHHFRSKRDETVGCQPFRDTLALPVPNRELPPQPGQRPAALTYGLWNLRPTGRHCQVFLWRE